jgi:hypothetical protein
LALDLRVDLAIWEKRIPFGKDRKKNNGNNRVGFCGFPPLTQSARQEWGTRFW